MQVLHVGNTVFPPFKSTENSLFLPIENIDIYLEEFISMFMNTGTQIWIKAVKTIFVYSIVKYSIYDIYL